MKFIAATAAALIGLAITGNATSAFAAELVAVPSATSVASALAVRFTGIETPTGTILLSLYASEAAFDAGGKPVASRMATVHGDTAEAVFPGLAPGRYAVKAFHDVDGDGNMGTTPFGMPAEPYAFSNDAVGTAGPARWAAASFDLGAGGTVHNIKIR
jgi:uncharacterized protein (DUF2141 family)